MKNLLSALLLLASLRVGHSAIITWDAGGVADKTWSGPTNTFVNWSSDSTPAGQDVVFSATGILGGSTTVTNSLDTNYSINSLTYNAASTNWQVTQINSPNTLTVGGNFTVGGLSGANTNRLDECGCHAGYAKLRRLS